MDRLEELRSDWQAECQPLVEESLAAIMPKVTAALPSSGQQTPEQAEGVLGTLLSDHARDWAEQRLVAHCLDWMERQGHWKNPRAPDNYVRTEVVAALQHLPGVEVVLPRPTPLVPLYAWALSAALGALVGMVPFALLGWALTGQRETGLVLGGVTGAAVLVLLVGWLAHSALVRDALTYALAVSTAGTLLGGIWAYWRQQATTGWVRAGLGLLAGWAVVLLARPRLDWPSTDDLKRPVEQSGRGYLRQVADLVLAWCWAHPERQPRLEPQPIKTAPVLPKSICRSLGMVQTLVASEDAGLRDAVEELLQRFEDEGFEWKVVPAGTPFDETMKGDFDLLNRIEPGQPVRTRRPALHLNQQLLQKGELQRA